MDESGDSLAFGEVKPSGEDRYPPSVMYGSRGLKQQFGKPTRSGQESETASSCTSVYRAESTPWHARFSDSKRAVPSGQVGLATFTVFWFATSLQTHGTCAPGTELRSRQWFTSENGTIGSLPARRQHRRYRQGHCSRRRGAETMSLANQGLRTSQSHWAVQSTRHRRTKHVSTAVNEHLADMLLGDRSRLIFRPPKKTCRHWTASPWPTNSLPSKGWTN